MKVVFEPTNDLVPFSKLRVGEAFLYPSTTARYIKSTSTRAIRFSQDSPPCNIAVNGNEEVMSLPDTEVIFK